VGQVVEESHRPDESQGLASISALACRGLDLGVRPEVAGSSLTGKGDSSSAYQWLGCTSGVRAQGLSFQAVPRGKRSRFVCEQISKEPQGGRGRMPALRADAVTAGSARSLPAASRSGQTVTSASY